MSSAAGAAYSEDPSGEQSALVRIEIEGGQPQRLARRGPIRRAEGLEPAVLEQLRDRVVEAEGELGEPAQLRWQCSSAGQLAVSAIGPIAAPLPWGQTPIPAHPRDQWSRANAGEVFPVVMTPLTWSLTLDALERGFRAPWSGLAQGRRFVALFEGYIYFNVGLILELLGDRLGLRTSDFLLAVGGPEAQQAAVDRIDYRRLLLSAPFLLRRGLQQRSLPRRWREARREAQRRRDELRQLDAEASSDQQLLRALTASGFYSAQFVEFLLHCQASVFGQVQFLLWLSESWIGDRGIALRLLQGLPGVLTAESNLDLWRLAERAGSDERAAALVGATPPAQLLEALAADPQSAWLAEALHEFLARHGHRTATELELSQPRWAEQPEPILSTFRDYVQHPQQSSPAQLQARQTASREAAERDAERALTANWLDRALPLRWLIYRSQMREAQSLQPLRENPEVCAAAAEPRAAPPLSAAGAGVGASAGRWPMRRTSSGCWTTKSRRSRADSMIRPRRAACAAACGGGGGSTSCGPPSPPRQSVIAAARRCAAPPRRRRRQRLRCAGSPPRRGSRAPAPVWRSHPSRAARWPPARFSWRASRTPVGRRSSPSPPPWSPKSAGCSRTAQSSPANTAFPPSSTSRMQRAESQPAT